MKRKEKFGKVMKGMEMQIQIQMTFKTMMT
jgi:hypothetical protein